MERAANRVTAAEAREILEKFKASRTEKPSYRRDGVVPNSTEHYLFHSTEKQQIRHGCQGEYAVAESTDARPGVATWRVAYLSVAESELLHMNADALTLLDQPCTYVGAAGLIQRLPRKLKVLEGKLIPMHRVYIGFSWFCLPQPKVADVESAMEQLVETLGSQS